jgi:hypothetical protein
MSRSFTIISVQKMNGSKINYTGGRYMSDTPRESVKKMFSKIIHSMPANATKSGISLKITLKETTSDSHKKEYSYKVTKKPQVTTIVRDGNEIRYKFVTKVKSI